MGLYLHNLGNSLNYRFRRLGKLEDLDDIIVYLKHALVTLPRQYQYQLQLVGCLNTLGNAFLSRFTRFQDIEEIQKANKFQEETALSTPRVI